MFKLDSPLMNFLNKVADIMILNVLFLIFSIPFFTIGAAFSAAYYMGFKMVKNEETYIVRGFWKAFKDNFKQGTIIWLLLVVVLGILTVDFRIILYSGIEFAQWIRIAMIAVTFVILLGVMFLFPLQARFINPVKNTIKNAFLMALSHLPTAFLLIVIYAVPVVVFYFIPQSLPIMILLAFGLVIYLKSFCCCACSSDMRKRWLISAVSPPIKTVAYLLKVTAWNGNNRELLNKVQVLQNNIKMESSSKCRKIIAIWRNSIKKAKWDCTICIELYKKIGQNCSLHVGKLGL